LFSISDKKKDYAVKKTSSSAKYKKTKKDNFINPIKDSINKEQNHNNKNHQEKSKKKENKNNLKNENLKPNNYDYISYDKSGQEKKYKKPSSFDSSS
jgi:hypothetical protein